MEKLVITTEKDLALLIKASMQEALKELQLSVPQDDPESPVKLMTLKECYLALRISRSTLEKLIKSKRIKTIKIGGRRFTDESDVTNFLKTTNKQ